MALPPLTLPIFRPPQSPPSAPDPEHPGDWTGANCRLLAPPPPGPPRDVKAERGGAACRVPAPPGPASRTCPLKERGPAPTAPHRGHQDARLLFRSIFISPFVRISLHWFSPRSLLRADSGERGHAAGRAYRPPRSHDGGR